MPLDWTETGKTFWRVNTAEGARGKYRLDLEQQPVDRWVLWVNGERAVDRIFFLRDAKKIAALYDQSGVFSFPPDLQLFTTTKGCGIVASEGMPRLCRPTGSSPILSRKDDSSGGEHAVISVCGVPPAPTGRNPDDWAAALCDATGRLGVAVNNAEYGWDSAVYSILDCVYSAQAKYHSMVLPILQVRLPQRRKLVDSPALALSDFVQDVDSLGDEKFEAYASELGNRQKISGRLKTEIGYESAVFFRRRGLETKADFLALGPDALEALVLEDWQRATRGIGPALAHYLLMLLGDPDHIKLDTHILRFWERMGGWVPEPGAPDDYALATSAFRLAAKELGTRALFLDHSIWQFESGSSS